MMGEIISALEGKIRVSGFLLILCESKWRSHEGAAGSEGSLIVLSFPSLRSPPGPRGHLVTEGPGIQPEHQSCQTLCCAEWVDELSVC